jgi:hypothetical protein
MGQRTRSTEAPQHPVQVRTGTVPYNIPVINIFPPLTYIYYRTAISTLDTSQRSFTLFSTAVQRRKILLRYL